MAKGLSIKPIVVIVGNDRAKILQKMSEQTKQQLCLHLRDIERENCN